VNRSSPRPEASTAPPSAGRSSQSFIPFIACLKLKSVSRRALRLRRANKLRRRKTDKGYFPLILQKRITPCLGEERSRSYDAFSGLTSHAKAIAPVDSGTKDSIAEVSRLMAIAASGMASNFRASDNIAAIMVSAGGRSCILLDNEVKRVAGCCLHSRKPV
jgi:hypothetical protein